jgi:hypothetical protein
MYNQSIITAPVALFLGAGASKPFGKMLMGEFIDYLEKQDQFKHANLLRDIIKVPDGRDLEYLFEELEEWSRKSYHVEDDKTLLRPRGDLAAVGESIVQRLARNATTITRALRREVFCAYRDIPVTSRKRLVKCFDVLFGVLLKGVDAARSPLVVFTTNYDPAIEAFCQAKGGEFRLCDGFVSQWNAGSPNWHRESFDQFQVRATNQKDVVLFKLHGSTSWFNNGENFIKSDAAVYAGDDSSFENILIYPARRKIASDDPFFTAYDYFQRTLENCKLCIVIGYSFRDYDALSRLRSAASYNPNLRLLVLDPGASVLTERLTAQGVNAGPLGQSFGDKEGEQVYLRAIRDLVSTIA